MWPRKIKKMLALICALLVVWYWYDAAQRMREHSMGTACAANMHMIHSALALYAQDYDQHLPIASVWMDRTQDYLHGDARTANVFHCPEVRQGPQSYGYGFNGRLSSAPILEYPRETVLVFDSQNTKWNATSVPVALASPLRHERKWPNPADLIMYIDGHVTGIDKQSTFLLPEGGCTIKSDFHPLR
jgi:hypothetical protein